MPPPPVTPSPHRFVIKKERKVRQTPLAQEYTPGPGTQFKSTPRFTFPSTPRPAASQTVSRATPAASRYLTPASKTPRDQDVIEEGSFEHVHESIETVEQDQDPALLSGEDYEEDYKIEEPTPKRRRISSSPDLHHEEEFDFKEAEEQPHHPSDSQDSLSSSLPILSSPPAPRRPISTAASRFLTSTPAPPATPLPPESRPVTFLRPPRFRPPVPSENAPGPSDPLPEQFSPHRKGQKYIPGGLAAEVRDWLVNIESAIPSKDVGKKGDDEWLVKVVVDEISGGSQAGMTMVRGRQVHSLGEEGEMVDTVGEVRLILAGESQGSGLQRGSGIEVGRRVGIKGPVWEVVIDGMKWGVGVDWKVLP